MATTKVFDLSVGDSGCGDVRLQSDGISLTVEIPYMKSRRPFVETIVYSDVIAFRYGDEMHSEDLDGTYDTVAEVIHSEWLRHLTAIEPEHLHSGVAGKRHFATFFSNWGYLEVIAAAVNLAPDRGTCEG